MSRCPEPQGCSPFLTELGGLDTLRGIEKAAYQRVMKQTAHDVINAPMTAIILASRLSTALAPFFRAEPHVSHSIDFNSRNEDISDMLSRQDCFESIFVLALKLKSFTATTDMKYAFLIDRITTPIEISPKPRIQSPDILANGQRSLHSNHMAIASIYISKPEVDATKQNMDSVIIRNTNFEARRPAENVTFYSQSIETPVGTLSLFP